MKYATIFDFGSTYTKVVCVDMKRKKVILTSKFPSTVSVDVEIAMKQCISIVKNTIGSLEYDKSLKLSSSSAAGGLRIAVSGLSQSLSTKAGRNASFGAGGKIVYTVSGNVYDKDTDKINNSGVLLCGGYEGGNSDKVLENAYTISKNIKNIPVIYAGNSFIAKDIRRIFKSSGKECFIAENMIPEIGKLNIDSTINIVRNIFMERIINMSGIGKIKSIIDKDILPTPMAVLKAGELLYQENSKKYDIGPFMLVDIGGATTDIYSFIENKCYNGAKIVGAPEPTCKRTVEGDMGMRESSISLIKEVGIDNFALKMKLSSKDIKNAISKRINDKEYIANSDKEKAIDDEIAAIAVNISARRHAGKITKEFLGGINFIQRGKNLTDIKTIIGTGGIIVNNDKERAIYILSNVELRKNEEGKRLLPEKVNIMIDNDYVFFAAGLLREYDEEIALSIIRESLRMV